MGADDQKWEQTGGNYSFKGHTHNTSVLTITWSLVVSWSILNCSAYVGDVSNHTNPSGYRVDDRNNSN